MLQNRDRKLDIVALALLAATLFVGTALVTYHRADPPAQLVYPPSVEVGNACGRMGAFVAHRLYETVGVMAWYVWGSLAAVTTLLVLRRDIDQPVIRATGWCISLVALASLAAITLPTWSPGPLVGAGGYVGAMGRAWLESNFAATGSYIFALCVLAAGLLLTTDYWLVYVAMLTGKATTQSLSRARALTANKLRTTDLPPDAIQIEGEADTVDEEEYEYEEEEAAEREPTIRTKADRAAEQADAEDDEEETAEAEEPVSLRQRVASALGLKKLPEGATAGAGAAAAGALVAANAVEPTKPTPINNVEALPIKVKQKSERDQIIEQLEAADQRGEGNFDYKLPPLDLLLPAEIVSDDVHQQEVRRKAKLLEKTFESFGFNVKVVEIETGPVIAQYEIQLESGLRLSKITSLSDDLAIALRVPSVRIVAPIPGKNTVGIEVPNEHRQLVRLRQVIEETNGKAKRMKIPIYLGQDVAGNPMAIDLAALPHLLIAGRTGTGKSVCLNSVIVSIIMSRGPDEVRMLMIDPKMVELSGYRKLPHLMHPVVTDMKKAEAILAWAVDKMEERYQMLARAGVRHISVYNQLGDDELRDRMRPASEAEWEEIPKQLPFIVIVADEMADLMMTAGKEVEQHIIRLAQKSRAVGIHLILATQKPTVDVITGLIKSNLPARIAFQVASRTDSRVVLDENGADKLLGNGDMLFLSPGTSQLLRGQGTYLSDDEITRVVDYVGTDEPQFAGELMQLKTKEETEATAPAALKNRDELYEAAVDIVVREGRGSVSLLQRALGIGYGRAARLIDFMAEDRIVGPYNGSNAREILISTSEWEAMSGGGAELPAATAPSAAPAKPPAATVHAEVDEEPEEEEAAEIDGDDESTEEYEYEYEEEEAGEEEYEAEEEAGEEEVEYEYEYEEEK